jgi:hypothetical protein
VVTPDGSNEAIEGEEFTLMCQVARANTTLLSGVTISYSWTRGEGSSRSEELGSSTAYTFIPQAGDHGATYHCRTTLYSATLDSPISVSSGFIVIDVLGKNNYHEPTACCLLQVMVNWLHAGRLLSDSLAPAQGFHS